MNTNHTDKALEKLIRDSFRQPLPAAARADLQEGLIQFREKCNAEKPAAISAWASFMIAPRATVWSLALAAGCLLLLAGGLMIYQRAAASVRQSSYICLRLTPPPEVRSGYCLAEFYQDAGQKRLIRRRLIVLKSDGTRQEITVDYSLKGG